MKKIVSLLLATIMIVSFSAVSFAATTVTIAGSNATVEQNATGDDAKVDVTFTVTYSEAFALQGIDAQLVYNKTNLTLNSYEIVDNAILAYNSTNSNMAPTAYEGVYLSFTDEGWTGATASTQYVLKCNFTVNDTATAATHEIGMKSWEAVDVNTYDTVKCTAPDYSAVKATITVGSAAETKTVGFLASMIYDSSKTGIEFTVTSSDTNLGPAKKQIAFTNLTNVESGNTTVTVGLNVTKVPKDVTLTAEAEAY